MVAVRQRFPRPRVEDPRAAAREGLARLLPPLRGRRVGVTAGSRGIRDIVPVLQGVLEALRAAGAEPVVVAAMGSHGSGTVEGKRRVLAHLGVTEATMGAPVLSGAEVVEIGRTPSGYTVYLDAHAAACDGLVAVNRVKPHTAFRDPIGSGLLKMLAVGLGNAPGAAQLHRMGAREMPRAIAEVATALVATGRVLAGVAILENAYDETARVEVLPPDAIAAREPELFAQARAWMPRLPVDAIDVLVVDEMGKTFSGTGMDVNVIGRWRHPEVPDPGAPRVRRIVALRLTDASEGNAQGVGLADVVTRRLAEAIDFGATYLNAIVSTYLERVFLPLVAPSDRAAIAVAVRTLGLYDPAAVRIVRIPNTLHLERLWVSPAVAAEVEGVEGVTLGRTVPWRFTPAGDLEVWGPAAWEEDEGAAADAGPDAPGRPTVADHER
jgi:hypothetical protein